MEILAIGLWGCFFGMTGLLLVGAGLAFTRSLHRIAFNAAMSAVASAVFAVAFLNVLPSAGAELHPRFLAPLTTLISGMLAYQLLSLMGLLRTRPTRRQAMLVLGAVCSLVVVAGWALAPSSAVALSVGGAGLFGVIGLGICLRSAFHGFRLAWTAVFSVFCMLLSVIGLACIALAWPQPLWAVHVISASAGTLYLLTLSYVLWARYAYLLELREVMAHGPAYDPVTRMRSHAETGQMVGEIFANFRDQPESLGIVVLTIANLYTLEKLHGAAAVNSAFFVCAGRLRRYVPAQVEMGRLGSDGFLLIMRNCSESGRLISLVREVEARLRKSVSLNTSRDIAHLETANTNWVADIGLGVMIVSNPALRGPSAVSMARGMSRAAMSYASRIAWFDHTSGEMMELPVLSAD